MGPGGELEPVVGWCREEWRVASLRRWVMDDDEPRDAAALDELPGPRDVQASSPYVVDLVGGPDR